MCVIRYSSYVPSKDYIEEVVKEITNGERGECPIYLELVEYASMDRSVHHMCH